MAYLSNEDYSVEVAKALNEKIRSENSGVEANYNKPQAVSTSSEYARHTSFLVLTTATRLDPTPLANRRTIFVQNLNTANVIYLGFGPNVNADTGIRLSTGGGNLTLNVGPNVEIWAIAATAGQTIAAGTTHVMETA